MSAILKKRAHSKCNSAGKPQWKIQGIPCNRVYIKKRGVGKGTSLFRAFLKRADAREKGKCREMLLIHFRFTFKHLLVTNVLGEDD